MHNLQLSYFDIHGGRGEPIRLALAIGGVPFEDHRVKPADWPAYKPSTPFGAMPVLTVDGRAVSQSNSILRFVGKLSDLYPSDPLQALLCDEIMDAAEDANGLLAPTHVIKDPVELKAAREALAAGKLAAYVASLAGHLDPESGWFADGRMTVADLKVFTFTRYLRSGRIDHLPVDLVERVAPALIGHHDRVRQHPGVTKWYADHGVSY
ncbi:MAG: glutathione S-transferase [Deltaproteobacteria bacterium HGW-Deltaproteobacteria-14]|jgi:glutathione S-transferase|nr:MAG: glutathione S-transferase [Deltaproteobacteria bacterium HGW-Deltaproteobacteria-14]